jgi:Papain family cysteine protease/Cathepsin propeptide inhibitor domain (I29)
LMMTMERAGDEETPLIVKEAEADAIQNENLKGRSTSVWRNSIAVIIFGIIGTIGLSVAVFQTQLMSSPQSPSLSLERIKKAEEAKLPYQKLSDEEVAVVFDDFKRRFNREYESPKEEHIRFKQFLKSLRMADDRNEKERAAGGTAIHGVTKFSDYSEDEMKQLFMGFTPVSAPEVMQIKMEAAVPKFKGDNEGEINWAGIYTTPVKNQGYCGSCWAFGAIQQIESDAIRAGVISIDQPLSTQQLVSW